MAKSYKKSKNEFTDGFEAIRADEIFPGKNGISHSDCQDARLNEDYDLIIIGAGPSGLFCAINSVPKDAVQKGKSILVLEKKDSPGHKLLISGSGRCNITHEGDSQAFLDHFGDHRQIHAARSIELHEP